MDAATGLFRMGGLNPQVMPKNDIRRLVVSLRSSSLPTVGSLTMRERGSVGPLVGSVEIVGRRMSTSDVCVPVMRTSVGGGGCGVVRPRMARTRATAASHFSPAVYGPLTLSTAADRNSASSNQVRLRNWQMQDKSDRQSAALGACDMTVASVSAVQFSSNVPPNATCRAKYNASKNSGVYST